MTVESSSQNKIYTSTFSCDKNILKRKSAYMTIGTTILKHRKMENLTQVELAQKIGVSMQAISKWETDVGLPDILQIIPLCIALDISTDELLNYKSKKQHTRIPVLRYDMQRYSCYCIIKPRE